MPKKGDVRITRDEAETVVVATAHEVIAYTTNPSHWRALKRRAARLGGTSENVMHLAGREVGGTVRFPADAFSLPRFGLRASPPKGKKCAPDSSSPE